MRACPRPRDRKARRGGRRARRCAAAISRRASAASSARASYALPLAQPRRVRTIHCGRLTALAAGLERTLDPLDEAPVHGDEVITRPSALLLVTGQGRRVAKESATARTISSRPFGSGEHSYGCPFGPPRIAEVWQHQRSRFGPNGQPPENSQLASKNYGPATFACRAQLCRLLCRWPKPALRPHCTR